MKDYKQVVVDRFETGKNESIYSEEHPIGKYSNSILNAELDKLVAWMVEENGPLDGKTILGLGCGDGKMLEYFIGKGILPENASGVDLSASRVDQAMVKLPGVELDFRLALFARLRRSYLEVLETL